MRACEEATVREVKIDAKVARVVAQTLRDRWTGVPRADAICHALSEIVMAATIERTCADEALRQRLLLKLEGLVPLTDSLVDVDVREGTVELRGIVPSNCKRRLICSIISEVEGVSQLRDHLIDVESGAFLLSPEDSATEFGPAAVGARAAHHERR
jgi:osmotically-inducible protein OsmY